MPTINIKTDSNTSNYRALEAVGKWMLSNYGGYQTEREITLDCGMRLKVKELAQRKGTSVCSCRFSVKRIDI